MTTVTDKDVDNLVNDIKDWLPDGAESSVEIGHDDGDLMYCVAIWGKLEKIKRIIGEDL